MATEPQPSPLLTFWRILTKFDPTDVSASVAARNAICITVPLVIGALLHNPGAGLIAASGALNAAFSDGHDPYRRRIQKMAAASVMCGVAVFFGAVTGHNHVLAVVVSSLWAFGVGMLGALGTAASDVGNISLFTLCVYASQSMSPENAAFAGLLALSGGLLQTASALVLWPTLPYQPERRALGTLYRALAEIAAAIPHIKGAPPATAQINRAQTILTGLSRDRTEQAERFLAALQYAERIRLSLLVLVRLRRRLEREAPDAPCIAALDRFTAHFAHDLQLVADGLATGRYNALPELAALKQLLDDLLQSDPPQISTFVDALVRDTERQVETLYKQLGGVLDVIREAVLARREPAKQDSVPWYLQLRGRVATLQANLNWDSAVFRHAVRLSVCIAIGDATARALRFGRSYWAPMTIAIVLKPDFSATFTRGILRIAGTVAGLILATLLFHAAPNSVAAQIVFIGVLSFFMRWLGPGNYGIVAVTVTAVVVMMIAGTGVQPGPVIAARATNTVLGGVLALFSYALWPTWERKRLRPIVAELLDSYRAYFKAVMDRYRGVAASDKDAGVDELRYAARVARTNAAASLDRAAVEPVTNREDLTALNAAMTRSNDFVKCVMALEAELPQEPELRDKPELARFEEDVAKYLSCLAAAFRASTPGEAKRCAPKDTNVATDLAEPYSMLNMEAERMVRALHQLTDTLQ